MKKLMSMGNLMKKVGAVVLAVAIMSTAMVNVAPTVVYAAGEVTLQPDNTGQGNVDVVGTVEPITTLDVTLPLSVNFTINADRTITWAPATINSDSPAPLVVTMLNTTPAVLTPEEIGLGYIEAPTLVADNAFADWDNLTKAQTRDNIAISINSMNLSVGSQVIGELESGFSAPTTLDLVGSAFYGKAWPNTTNQLFKYNMVLELAMK